MMWLPAVVLAGLALLADDGRREANRKTPGDRRTQFIGWVFLGIILLAFAIVVQEATLQTLAWLS